MIIAAGIVGYVIVGLIALRIGYVLDAKDGDAWDSDDAPFMIGMASIWPGWGLLLGIYGVGFGVWKLVTLPTRQQRRETKLEEVRKERERLDARIKELEKDIGMKVES